MADETNEKKTSGSKMIFAVLQGDDYENVVRALNENGFFVTLLNSSGGFLRRRNVTIMIGVGADRLEAALKILKERAGHRQEEIYQPAILGDGSLSSPMVPIKVSCGGITVFIMDMDRIEKY